MSTTTGPGLPVRAISKAVRTVDSRLSGSVTRKTCLATEPITAVIGASWNASVPMAALGTCPQMTTIGTEVSHTVPHRSHAVGRAGAGGDDGDSDLSAGAGVPGRHEAGALLIGRER